jgi:putative ABC transport system substrate-binding protein
LIAAGAGIGTSCGILQLPSRQPVVATIWATAPDDNEPYRAAIRDGLEELGWHDGKNLQLVWRFTDGTMEGIRAAASDLVHDGVDVIVTPSAPRP